MASLAAKLREVRQVVATVPSLVAAPNVLVNFAKDVQQQSGRLKNYLSRIEIAVDGQFDTGASGASAAQLYELIQGINMTGLPLVGPQNLTGLQCAAMDAILRGRSRSQLLGGDATIAASQSNIVRRFLIVFDFAAFGGKPEDCEPSVEVLAKNGTTLAFRYVPAPVANISNVDSLACTVTFVYAPREQKVAPLSACVFAASLSGGSNATIQVGGTMKAAALQTPADVVAGALTGVNLRFAGLQLLQNDSSANLGASLGISPAANEQVTFSAPNGTTPRVVPIFANPAGESLPLGDTAAGEAVSLDLGGSVAANTVLFLCARVGIMSESETASQAAILGADPATATLATASKTTPRTARMAGRLPIKFAS